MSTVTPDAMGEPSAPRAGADLRAARERLGWPIEHVSQSLRIRITHLEALEEGRIDLLPGSTYAVGFLRTYARTLGLDPDEVARRFKAEASEVNRRTELVFPAPIPQRGLPAGAIVLLSICLAVFAYAGWYRLSGEGRLPAETVTPVPQRLARLADRIAPPGPARAPGQGHAAGSLAARGQSGAAGSFAVAAGGGGPSVGTSPDGTPASGTSPGGTSPGGASTRGPSANRVSASAASAAGTSAGGTSPGGTATGGTSTGGAVPGGAAGSVASAASPAGPGQQAAAAMNAMPIPLPQSVSPTSALAAPLPALPMAQPSAAIAGAAPVATSPIVLQATADAWLEVRDGSGAVLLNRVLHKGDSWPVPPQPNLLLTTGNAGGTEIVVDGVAYPVPGGAGAVRRNIKLDASLIKAGSQPPSGAGLGSGGGAQAALAHPATR